MAVSLVQNVNNVAQVDPVNHSTQAHTADLEKLAEPNASDVSTFNSALQNLTGQSLDVPAANSTYSVNFIAKMGMSLVDSVQENRQKLGYLTKNISKLDPKQTLELQKVADELSVGTQFLSKCVGVVIKDIDTLIHMQ
jgi:hypothetical protein